MSIEAKFPLHHDSPCTGSLLVTGLGSVLILNYSISKLPWGYRPFWSVERDMEKVPPVTGDRVSRPAGQEEGFTEVLIHE